MKFKGISISKQKVVYGYLRGIPSKRKAKAERGKRAEWEEYERYYIYDSHDVAIEVEPDVCSSIGIADKNGKDIFEKDKVRVTCSNGEATEHTVIYYAFDGYPAYDISPTLIDEVNNISMIMNSSEYEIEVI